MKDFSFLQEQAYEYLCQQIRDEQIVPGKIYSEAAVAKALGCSRTPVKDALTRLSHGKYIDIIPSKGFALHRLTKEDLMNTFQTRVAIESFCAISLQRALDTPRGAAAVAVLRQQVLLQEQYAKENRFDEFLRSDILFHQTIIRFSENEDFQELYELHSYRIEEPARKCLREGDRCKETSGEHAAILRAIEHGDISHCYEAILRHNESTLEHSLQMLSQQDIL